MAKITQFAADHNKILIILTKYKKISCKAIQNLNRIKVKN
jgi:hypothetical protein